MTTQLNSKGTSIVKYCLSNMNDFPLQNNKYVIFYSLWPCLSHTLVESYGNQMYLFCFVIIVIMAGFKDETFLSLDLHNKDMSWMLLLFLLLMRMIIMVVY